MAADTHRFRKSLLRFAAFFAFVLPVYASEPPQHIVSLDICADQLLLLLAEPERIASITWLSADPEESPVAEQAARLRLNHGLAEEVIPLHPDLVFAGTYAARFTVQLLRHAGFRVELIEPAVSLKTFRGNLRRIAEQIGAKQRGEQILAEFDQALTGLAPPPNQTADEWPTALLYGGNGYTAGTQSLENDLLYAAGLRNLAGELGLEYSSFLDLETLLSQAPDILVVTRYHQGAASLATHFLQHPALRERLPGQLRMEIHSRWLSCVPDALLEAVRRLRAAREQILNSDS